ncbi:hypothetical protein EYS09_03890 [Streptomyces kasugaensis]|uniref:Uncharacterized protein n=1 Tax=Streptomyces kasugaensis TaxID=1946 RepID=A0A4Q9I2K9_STRKA|nr:hypothetical protein [Streptomyces kasugaensis]TBO60920.1 hypothetical protein EYS09_03890 [Streptomyces kasugaensis]
MSAPVAGQRAGQRPMRAAVAAQRALGRMAADQSSISGELIVNIDGRWFRQYVDDHGQMHRDPIPAP